MRVAFVHDGVPSSTDGSKRAVHILKWLSDRHEVELITTQVTEPAAGGAWADHVRWVPMQPAASRLTQSIGPGLGFRLAPRDVEQMSAATNDADWIWVGWWPLIQQPSLMETWRTRNAHVSWDEDSLSLGRLLSARALALRSPLRASARFVAGLTYRRFERTALSECDSIVARSPRDAEYLARMHADRVMLVRNAVSLAEFEPARTQPPSRCDPVVLFCGSNYEPNVHGLRWFLARVWPAISRSVPKARLVVVGNGMTPSALGQVPRSVEVIGEVESLVPFLSKARACISPVFYGAGLPTKVLEAGAASRPSVASEYCVRSIGATDGMLVASRAADWIRKLGALLADGDRADSLGRDGLRLATRFSTTAMHQELTRLEERVQSR